MTMVGPAHGIGGALLSRLDLTEEAVVKDATAELHRCASTEAYAAWAKRWGDLAMARLRDLSGFDEDWVIPDEHEDALEAKRAIEVAGETLLEEVRSVLKDSKGPKTEAINEAADKFASVLAQNKEPEE